MSNFFFGQGSGYISASGLSATDVANIKLVTPTQWNALQSLNQGLSTTSSPTFYNVSVSNMLKLMNSTNYIGLQAPTLTSNRTITFPDADVNLGSLPNQALNTTSTPYFTRLGVGVAADASKALYVNQGIAIGASLHDASASVQGLHMDWNRGLNGVSYILNQKGLGSGGILFGDLGATNDAVTEWGGFDSSGILYVKNSTYSVTFAPTTLTGNRTITLPNSNIDLQYVGNQSVSTTSTPQFSTLNLTSAGGLTINSKTPSDTQWGYLTALNQSLATSTTPQFSKLGLNQAAGTEALEVSGCLKVSSDSAALAAAGGAHIRYATGTAESLYLNHKGTGPGGHIFGTLADNNTYTSWGGFTNLGKFYVNSGSYISSFTPTTLTGDHTITLPNADVDLQYVPSQSVNTSSTPQFTRLGVGNAADASKAISANQGLLISGTNHAATASTQGLHLDWNRGANGVSYILNQKGLGSGGILFGDLGATNDAVTEWGGFNSSGQMYVKESGYACTLTPTTLTTNRTITLPNASIDLQYVGNQGVSTTSTPQFAKIGVAQAAGTEVLEVTGNITTTGTIYTNQINQTNDLRLMNGTAARAVFQTNGIPIFNLYSSAVDLVNIPTNYGFNQGLAMSWNGEGGGGQGEVDMYCLAGGGGGGFKMIRYNYSGSGKTDIAEFYAGASRMYTTLAVNTAYTGSTDLVVGSNGAYSAGAVTANAAVQGTSLKIANSSYTSTLSPATLTANRTISVPNADVNLANVPTYATATWTWSSNLWKDALGGMQTVDSVVHFTKIGSMVICRITDTGRDLGITSGGATYGTIYATVSWPTGMTPVDGWRDISTNVGTVYTRDGANFNYWNAAIIIEGGTATIGRAHSDGTYVNCLANSFLSVDYIPFGADEDPSGFISIGFTYTV